MKMQKVFIVLLASLIGMLLCTGVALAGNCCIGGAGHPGEPCTCIITNGTDPQGTCVGLGGIWMGPGGCSDTAPYSPCDEYWTGPGCSCVPEMSTIALLATGLICMAGYLRLRRKEE